MLRSPPAKKRSDGGMATSELVKVWPYSPRTISALLVLYCCDQRARMWNCRKLASEPAPSTPPRSRMEPASWSGRFEPAGELV